MTYESCRVLFHQFIRWDKPHQIAADLNRLPSFTAALVRRAAVDRPDQFVLRAARGLITNIYN